MVNTIMNSFSEPGVTMAAFMGIPSDTEFSRRLAERIVSMRKANGMTQTDVADKLGITQQSFARYEAGQRRFPVNILPTLAEALDVSIEELIGVATEGRRGRTSQLERRFQKIRQLPKKDQEFVLQVLDKVIGEDRKTA